MAYVSFNALWLAGHQSRGGLCTCPKWAGTGSSSTATQMRLSHTEHRWTDMNFKSFFCTVGKSFTEERERENMENGLCTLTAVHKRGFTNAGVTVHCKGGCAEGKNIDDLSHRQILLVLAGMFELCVKRSITAASRVEHALSITFSTGACFIWIWSGTAFKDSGGRKRKSEWEPTSLLAQ